MIGGGRGCRTQPGAALFGAHLPFKSCSPVRHSGTHLPSTSVHRSCTRAWRRICRSRSSSLLALRGLGDALADRRLFVALALRRRTSRRPALLPACTSARISLILELLVSPAVGGPAERTCRRRGADRSGTTDAPADHAHLVVLALGRLRYALSVDQVLVVQTSARTCRWCNPFLQSTTIGWQWPSLPSSWNGGHFFGTHLPLITISFVWQLTIGLHVPSGRAPGTAGSASGCTGR